MLCLTPLSVPRGFNNITTKIPTRRTTKPINSILVTNSGFWVKQGNVDGNDMIYAKSLDSKSMQFNDVIVF